MYLFEPARNRSTSEQKIKQLEDNVKKLKREIENMSFNNNFDQATYISSLESQLNSTKQELYTVSNNVRRSESEAASVSQLNKLNEEALKKAQQVNEEQKLLIQKLCAFTKVSVTCSICSRIFAEPVELPCSNTICKSHVNDFERDDCIFCNHRHEIKSDALKLDERISQPVAMGLHLFEQENKLKYEFDQLFSETRRLST